MFKWKRLISLVTVVALILSLAVGCGQKPESPASTDTSSKEKYPDRPITIIINYAAGGQTDIAIRLMAKVAEKELGVPIIINNQAGGGGTVGLVELSKAKNDGYTIGTVTIAAASVTPQMQKTEYDPFKDYDYISGVGRYLYGISVKTSSPYKSIKDVAEAARKQPGKITFGTMTTGVALALKFVEAKENVKMTYIPQKSGQETVTSLIGGHTDLAIGTPDAIDQFIKNKEAITLAVASEARWSWLPDVPTMKELGYDIDVTGWMALAAPVGTPKDRLQKIYDAFKKGHDDPEVKATMDKLHLSAPYITGDEVKKVFQQRATDWKPLIDLVLADQKK